MARDLHGMAVLITGASSGIGAALARELHNRGARLALNARREERLAKLNEEVGGDALVLPGDVSDEATCRELVQKTVKRFGRLDTLVANAGYGLAKPVDETTHEEMQQMFAVNVFGTSDCARFAVEVMKKQPIRDGYRGQIVMTSSGAARRGLPFAGAYSATKAAQLSLAEAMRVELKPEKIAVTSVHPIGTSTEFFDVAEREGSVKIAGVGSRSKQQTPELVARKMADAIRKPTREVWTSRATRLALGINSVLPGVGDFVMSRFRDEVKRDPKNAS